MEGLYSTLTLSLAGHWQATPWQCFYQLQCCCWSVKCPPHLATHIWKLSLKWTQLCSWCWQPSKFKISKNRFLLFSSIHSFMGISATLPETGYIKMIDVWMIFTMTYPFIVISLHCLQKLRWNFPLQSHAHVYRLTIYFYRVRENTMKYLLTLLLPVFGMIFTIVFFSVGLYIYHFPNIDQYCIWNILIFM